MLPKAYEAAAVEDEIYTMWNDSGAFVADNTSKKEPFTISMPPPNATGQLHLGHAVMLALQDIFIRFARMQGRETLWVPGTDHAAIATESLVIRLLREEGMKDPREELGREKLLEKIAEFVDQSQGTIRGQVRKMGCSCDWTRERYTMEPTLNRCVNEVFVKMHKDGLIYRGHRIVNWDPKLQTTVSDDEMEHVEETAPFYTFQYGPFEIGTVRPETKFGDKYVVMHPDDERYKKYKHGDMFECEWINGPIHATIIKDKAVDPEFGTGVMTITPWHTAVDFEIAERHGLEKEQVIDFDGKLLPIAGEFEGMDIHDARPKIVEKLKEKGLLVRIDENYVHNKAIAQRGKGVIEPQIKLQWFIDVNRKTVDWSGQKMSLKEIMHSVVHHGDIKIIPERFNKTYFHWIDNLRDWCISRQIWWGHRIPVWYKDDEVYCGTTPPEGNDPSSAKASEGKWEQDHDTLDTWFSSALWTWSTLIDAQKAGDFSLSLKELLAASPDYQKFHPTQVLETGYDIIFFWVARMILMTTYATGEVPFETVYMHGMVRTREGKKMSKSDPKTMINPLDMIDEYGADALRLSMIVGQSPGNDTRLYKEKIAGYRNFINKLWNASRFVLMQCEQAGVDPKDVQLSADTELGLADKALLSQLDRLVEDVTKGLEEYRLSETGERLYSFVWDFFCDWYLELSKGEANVHVLVHTLRTVLELLHPYCPFVTEELWKTLKHNSAPQLISQTWPTSDVTIRDEEYEQAFQILVDTISAVRKLRAEQGIEPAKKLTVTLKTSEWTPVLEGQQEHIRRMARIESLTITDADIDASQMASAFLKGVEVHVSLDGLVDSASLEREKKELEQYITGLQAKLANEKFVSNAPDAVVDEVRSKLEDAQSKLEKVNAKLG